MTSSFGVGDKHAGKNQIYSATKRSYRGARQAPGLARVPDVLKERHLLD